MFLGFSFVSCFDEKEIDRKDKGKPLLRDLFVLFFVLHIDYGDLYHRLFLNLRGIVGTVCRTMLSSRFMFLARGGGCLER